MNRYSPYWFDDMKSPLLYLCLSLLSLNVIAEEKILTFSYWNEAAPPFVFSSDKKLRDLQSGVIKDLGDLIAKRLNATPNFVNMPVQRLETYLASGEVDINCITNPVWKKNPDSYNWSPALFSGADRILVKAGESHQVASFEDLKGKSLGVYNGYVYHPKIMQMIEDGEIDAVKVTDIDHGVQLLLLDRVDALIDFDILLSYKLNDVHKNSLVFAELIPETYKLYCAYSKKMLYDKEKIDEIITKMVSDGEVDKILHSY